MTTREAIKAIRQSRGWNQAQLAERLGVPQQRVSEWEREKNTKIPSPHNLAQLVLLSQEYGHELLLALAGPRTAGDPASRERRDHDDAS